MTPHVAPPGARCALHGDAPATEVCARCGNFMCQSCSAMGSEPFCPTCRRVRVAGDFPFRRDAFDLGSLFSYCWARLRQEWVMLSVGVVLYFAFAFAGSLVQNLVTALAMSALGIENDPSRPFGPGLVFTLVFSFTFGIVITTTIQGVGVMGLYRMAFDVLAGGRADVNRMFLDARKLPRYLATVLATFAVTVVPFGLVMGVVGALAAASGIDALRDAQPVLAVGVALASVGVIAYVVWLSPMLFFAVPEVVLTDDPPMECLRRAYRIGAGFRASLIGYALVAGVIAIVGLLACCVGAIPASALAYLLLAGLFLALRNDPAFPRPDFSGQRPQATLSTKHLR